jgi:hypothetical protein
MQENIVFFYAFPLCFGARLSEPQTSRMHVEVHPHGGIRMGGRGSTRALEFWASPELARCDPIARRAPRAPYDHRARDNRRSAGLWPAFDVCLFKRHSALGCAQSGLKSDAPPARSPRACACDIFAPQQHKPTLAPLVWAVFLFYKHAAPKGAKNQPCGLLEKRPQLLSKAARPALAGPKLGSIRSASLKCRIASWVLPARARAKLK